MVSVYDIKPRFQALLRPLVRRLAARGVSANAVTIAAALLSIGVGTSIALFPEKRALYYLLPATLFLRIALNAIDGMLAREHDMKSRLGAILNEVGDVVSDCALYLPLALASFVPTVPIVLIVILALLTEFTGVCATMIGAERRYDGPMGKSDRALAFGVLGLVIGLGGTTVPWLEFTLLVIAGLLALTICRRAASALKESSDAH